MNCLRKHSSEATFSVTVLSWAVSENSSFAERVSNTDLYTTNCFMGHQWRWSSLKDNLSSSTVWAILGESQYKPMTPCYQLKHKIAWTILTLLHCTFTLWQSLEVHHRVLLHPCPNMCFSWFWWDDEGTFKILYFVRSLQCMACFTVYCKLQFRSKGFLSLTLKVRNPNYLASVGILHSFLHSSIHLTYFRQPLRVRCVSWLRALHLMWNDWGNTLSFRSNTDKV